MDSIPNRIPTRIARQALADAQTLYHRGYEVLSRAGETGRFYPPSDPWGWQMVDLGVLGHLHDSRISGADGIDGFVTVNVSPETLCGNSAWDMWFGGLQRLLDARPNLYLGAEVSERCIGMCPKLLDRRIRSLHECGMLVALDDLVENDPDLMIGLYFRHAWDIVKIDYRPATRGPNRRIDDLIAGCHERGIPCIVEGIENGDDIAQARAWGADMIQGFGIHRPALV